MAQREQVLDRAQRLQQAFVNDALRNQARQQLGPIPEQPVYSGDAPIETIRMSAF
jgi:hypothetical protein